MKHKKREGVGELTPRRAVAGAPTSYGALHGADFAGRRAPET